MHTVYDCSAVFIYAYPMFSKNGGKGVLVSILAAVCTMEQLMAFQLVMHWPQVALINVWKVVTLQLARSWLQMMVIDSLLSVLNMISSTSCSF